jgi:hypothetical protein
MNVSVLEGVPFPGVPTLIAVQPAAFDLLHLGVLALDAKSSLSDERWAASTITRTGL